MTAASTATYGKFDAYNTLPLLGIKIQWGTSDYVEYYLGTSYQGKTLLEIVNVCMSNRNDKYTNDNTIAWEDGCIISSTSFPTSSSGAALSQATSLKIGVGDGSSDSNDWSMFYMFDDNGDGDFGGKNKGRGRSSRKW